MKETVLFFLLTPFADWEYAYLSTALNALAGERYEIKTVSTTGRAHSLGGLAVIPDYTAEAAPKDYAGLILIGGMSWRTAEAAKARPLVEAARKSGRVLGGICDAAGFLGTLGVLNDVRHTANDLEDMKRWAGEAYAGEARFVRKQAVRDGNVVTANGTAPLEFAREALLALNAAPAEQIEAWFTFHKRGLYQE